MLWEVGQRWEARWGQASCGSGQRRCGLVWRKRYVTLSRCFWFHSSSLSHPEETIDLVNRAGGGLVVKVIYILSIDTWHHMCCGWTAPPPYLRVAPHHMFRMDYSSDTNMWPALLISGWNSYSCSGNSPGCSLKPRQQHSNTISKSFDTAGEKHFLRSTHCENWECAPLGCCVQRLQLCFHFCCSRVQWHPLKAILDVINYLLSAIHGPLEMTQAICDKPPSPSTELVDITSNRNVLLCVSPTFWGPS